MSKPNVSMIAAITSKNRALGMNGQLIARISDDLKRFKELTSGHAVIMGRKTYESIGRLLPNRKNFIVSRNSELKIPYAIVCQSLEEAIEKASGDKEIFIIGGGEIYKQGLLFANKIYLTIVESDAEGDVFFPDYSEFKKETFREDRKDEKTQLSYSWVNLER